MAQIPENQLMDLIRKDIDEEHYSRAELKILQWLEARPENPHAWSYLGFLYSKTGKRWACHNAHGRSVALAPNEPSFLSNYGNSHIGVGKAQQGIPYLRKAVELAPTSLRYRQNLAYILRDNCEYEEAATLQRQILAEDPDNHAKRFDLGCILLHLRKLDEAWKYYESRPVRKDRQSWFDQVAVLIQGKILRINLC